MTLKKLLTFAVLFFCTLSTQAVPAKPGVKKMFRMADGTMKELTLCGDEHFSFYKDDNGQAYRLSMGEQLLPMTLQEVSETWTARRKARQVRHVKLAIVEPVVRIRTRRQLTRLNRSSARHHAKFGTIRKIIALDDHGNRLTDIITDLVVEKLGFGRSDTRAQKNRGRENWGKLIYMHALNIDTRGYGKK